MKCKDFTITEVKPKIFHFNFKDQYKMAMHFLRYQEYYESPNPKFRNKPFEIFDFMEWYSKEYGNGAFTYATDWEGFNFPADILKKLYNGCLIPDLNNYDYTMCEAYNECREKCGDDKLYIIGSVGSGEVMKHEIAHGFFYLNKTYKKEMTKLVKALKPSLLKQIYKRFKDIGYTEKVYVDECQAYLSTGAPFLEDVYMTGDEETPFIELYEKYYTK